MSIKDEKVDNESYSKNFTRVPNILFVAYCDLTKEEKYLYSDLRCIYWDMKPRFVSLRELSGQTKYSVSALSKMLPRLHDAGLVHAEIQREKARNGREKGMPKYHITIVDIWEVNRLFFSCSPKEQVELAEVPSARLVHEIEQACSRNNTRVFTKNDKLVSFGEQDQAQIERAKDNNKDTSKDPFKDEENSRASIDDAILTQLQEKNCYLEAELARVQTLLQEVKSLLPPQGGVTLTPAGRNTALDGGNSPTQEPTFPQSSTLPEKTEANFLDNAIPEPLINATDSLVQDTSTKTRSETTPSESQRSAKESTSSTQAVNGTSNQATEQPQEQPTNHSYSPSMATNNQPAENPPATKKPRGGRGKKAEQPEQGQLIVLAPEMPPATAKWNEETAVQIIEAKKGRRYSDTTRSQEKTEARKILDMYYGDSLITREQFEKSWDKMFTWSCWSEYRTKPMIKHLRKDDRIITILDELEPKSKPAPKQNGNIRQFPQTAPQERSSVLVSEEARARNLARLRANAAAAQAQA